jgi:hypothetical protein
MCNFIDTMSSIRTIVVDASSCPATEDTLLEERSVRSFVSNAQEWKEMRRRYPNVAFELV